MRAVLAVLAVIAWMEPLSARGDRAEGFDYFVLSLSWSPTWCALEGAARGAPQCDETADLGWILHGLWPQFHRGWPSYCRTDARAPSRAMTAGMADIMGSPGLAWHQWKKHGVCAGVPAQTYFDLARRAFEAVARPEAFRRLDRAVTLPAAVVEEAFLNANPQLDPDMITVTCKNGRIEEARICLSKSLNPVRCGDDVIRDCRKNDALMAPIP
ncbi:ribonuclease T2 [Marivita sp. GX14005]|uniref:ribonuclease T2 n=1 Tax=Marivita sp. GX14005 TaxID=2942276 RepID=UPI002018BDC9|nr:ribonuclease T2 [Marivita sp. GX14005]MCL3880976.1 ribonuclease T2 [Marivita sp. GX14005]